MEAPHLLLQFRDLLLQMARLGFETLGRLLPVRGVELLQIAGDTVLDLRHATLHLRPGKVLVAVVHRLELAAVIATLASVSSPRVRHSATNRAQTWRMAWPLSLRKSAIVL